MEYNHVHSTVLIISHLKSVLKILKKIQPLSLYWFAAQHQNSKKDGENKIHSIKHFRHNYKKFSTAL